MEVGVRLRQVRGGAGLSQEEFVATLGHGTRRAMVDYENGKVLLPSSIAQRVCDRFGVSFNWLMTGSGIQRTADIIRDAQSRRAGVEAQEALRAIRQIVEKYASSEWTSGLDRNRPNDLFSAAMRLALGRLERDFKERRGVVQICSFIEDLIVTSRDLLSDELRSIEQARQDEVLRLGEKVLRHLGQTRESSIGGGAGGLQQEPRAASTTVDKHRRKVKGTDNI
jgi:transcriptional regulator with XRE-family HTH domain